MPPYISIIIPVYNEEENIKILFTEIDSVLSSSYEYEIIFINDGSTDNSWKLIEELSKLNNKIKGIELAGNFGQTIALRAGFDHASGEVIIAMDGDLQHDPKYIPEFIKHINLGYDIVGAAKENSSKIGSQLSKMAHWLIYKITGIRMSYFGATYKAYRSYMVQNLNMIGDSHRFLAALIVRKGIRYTEFPITISPRKNGKSNYSLIKAFPVFIDLIFLKFIISYFKNPFRIFGVIGLTILVPSFLFSGYLIAGSLFGGINIKEDFLAEFLFALVLIIMGILFLGIGTVAEIGVFNYYLKNNKTSYKLRKKI